MSLKAQYVLYSILDFGLTFGGSAGVVVYNYITPTNSLGFKLSLTGILLLVGLVFTAKTMFEKSYRNRLDSYLQQLAEATDEAVKKEIAKKIDSHKTKNYIYERLMILLPFGLLYVVTYIADSSLQSLQGSLGLILVSMGGGSVFNIVKKPVGEKVKLEKIKKKVAKKSK